MDQFMMNFLLKGGASLLQNFSLRLGSFLETLSWVLQS